MAKGPGRPATVELNRKQMLIRLQAIEECGETAKRALKTLELLGDETKELPNAHSDTESHVRYLNNYMSRIMSEVRSIIQ